jgi:hypothetical protein
MPGETRGPARPSERRVGDHGDPQLGATFEDSPSQCAVVEGVERDRDGGDGGELQRLVQVPAVDIRQPHAAHKALVPESRQRAHGRPPRRPRIGCMDEVEIDREAVQRSQARLAVGQDRLRAAIRDPPAAGARHASLRHDPRARRRATVAQGAHEQSLVVPQFDLVAPVRPSGLEHRHTRRGRGGDRLESALLVAIVIRRQAHAAKTDAELRGVKPFEVRPLIYGCVVSRSSAFRMD